MKTKKALEKVSDSNQNRIITIILGLAIGYAGVSFAVAPTLPPAINTLPADLLVKNILFKEPGTQNLVITNQTKSPIKINSVNFGDTQKELNNVRGIGIDSARCTVLQAGSSCNVAVTTAPETHHGNNLLHIDYNLNGQQKSTSINVGVNITQLAFYEIVNDQLIPTNGELSISATKSPQTFALKNIGSFAWHGTIDWHGSGISGVTKKADFCKSLSQNQTCTFQLFTDPNAIAGNTATLRTTGDTIDDIDNNVVVSGDIAIMPDENPQHKLYPAYSSVKLENTTKYDANIINIVISKSLRDDKVKFCSPTDSTCFYKSDSSCDMNGGALPAGKSCVMWFKSLPNESADISTTDGTIGITAFVEWKPTVEQLKAQKDLPTNIKLGVVLPKKKTFYANYVQDLYAAGNFYGQVAKWDGNNWTTLGLGFSGNLNWLTSLIYTGHLVVGGYFNMAEGKPANNLASWDGKKWNALISTPTGGNGVSCDANCYTTVGVAALKAIDGGYAYDAFGIGGYFDIIGGIPANNSYAYYVGQSNGTGTFAGLGKRIDGLIRTIELPDFAANCYYLGGQLSAAVDWWGKHYAKNIVAFLYDYGVFVSIPHGDYSASWYDMGLDGPVYALKSHGTNLYIGGMFNESVNPYGQKVLHKITQWDATTDSYFPLGNGFDDAVYALEFLNNVLYAGGSFTSSLNPGATVVNHIAQWNGSSWFPVSGGVNGLVYKIAAFNGNLYVGGDFTTAGGNVANHIAKWDGKNWLPLGEGLFGGPVTAIAFGTTLTISNP